jgi:hypothetical protein
MNPIDDSLLTGTYGELLVQLRLLQCGVQAAPPLKDSGNDLIAVKGPTFRAVQVETKGPDTDRFDLRGLPELYHLLALVALEGERLEIDLNSTKIFLITSEQVKAGGWATLSAAKAEKWGLRLDADNVDRLVRPDGAR